MIKTKFLIIAVLLLQPALYCQQSSLLKAIAPFNITLEDGHRYTITQLRKNIPVALIYFSPDCDHCLDFVKILLQHKKQLSTLQLVMVCCEPVDKLKNFCKQFTLSEFPTIKVGTEGNSFVVRYHYGVTGFPFIALYDKRLKPLKILPYQQAAKDLVNQLFKVLQI